MNETLRVLIVALVFFMTTFSMSVLIGFAVDGCNRETIKKSLKVSALIGLVYAVGAIGFAGLVLIGGLQ